MPSTQLSTPKVALITGITGQDGSYLAEFLLEKGYIVHGIKRRASSFNTQRVDHIYQDPHIDNANFKLHYGDLTDTSNLVRIVQETQPDEIYNLGAQSHVAVSFESPEYTADVDGMGTLRILEATGVQYTVRQFIEKTAAALGKQIRGEGEGVNEVGYWVNPPPVIASETRQSMPSDPAPVPVIGIDPGYLRPTEVETLLGDPSKAKLMLGWVPEITLDQMIEEVSATDWAEAKKHALLKRDGYDVSVSVE